MDGLLELAVVQPQVDAVGDGCHAALIDGLRLPRASEPRLRIRKLLPVPVTEREQSQEAVVCLPQPRRIVLRTNGGRELFMPAMLLATLSVVCEAGRDRGGVGASGQLYWQLTSRSATLMRAVHEAKSPFSRVMARCLS